ncbi:hypothetical protein [Capillibacterium thermochitinicola]|jgi:hypothetical protein|uniref:Glyoxalase-like domain-containing protein n=1 Tax=Capillibacterium thermochitinicola TaxID=2699427 RepID=A0A8J6LNW5_9FIRM|nr:hypothetical protein [Capillibacterium thermochitinicola]MBA2134103.1 hypothetical protein [Capillibacterium thermochitinicola]
MVRLDHFVVNIDNNMEKLKELKKQIEPLGYPFEPTWGKGTKGFKVANIWIGLQYLEMVWLKKKDGGGWKPDWVEKYNNGHRGIIAIYLMTDKLDEIREELKGRGIPVSDPERISFRWFFGLFKKTMPWRSIFTASIPGTDLEICYGELDSPDIMEKMKAYMVPNAADNGIEGIKEAIVRGNFSEEAWGYIRKLFPDAEQHGNCLKYDMGTTCLSFESWEKPGLNVELKAETTNKKYLGKSFTVENLRITTM